MQSTFMHKAICVLAIASSLFVVGSAVAQALSTDARKEAINPEQSKLNQQKISYSLAPIRSENDLWKHLQASGNSSSPLDILSPTAKEVFLSSLTFNEKGLTGFRYTELEQELSASQIYKLLSLFGAQYLASTMQGAKVLTELDQLILTGTRNDVSHQSSEAAAQSESGTPSQLNPTLRRTNLPSTECDVASYENGCEDYKGYRCSAHGTCSPSAGDICTHNC